MGGACPPRPYKPVHNKEALQNVLIIDCFICNVSLSLTDTWLAAGRAPYCGGERSPSQKQGARRAMTA